MSQSSTVFSVSELTFAIKNQLESRFNSLTIRGEISNAKLHSSGHLYFDLKDASSKISAVMFRSQYQKVARPPKEGDQVVLKGAISVYAPHGRYQIIASSLEYAGVGELLLKLEELKIKLHSKGWFAQEHKKPLPKFPKTIGVVTSPTGAVIRDIIHVLSRRFAGFQLLLFPVRVQGNEAPEEIAKAINAFNQHTLADVLIVGRGGGSLEDLWAFNDERVAKSIFESAIPIVSAVGHETDVTIADFIADVRAPTPSAAAEIVSAEKKQQLQNLQKLKTNLSHSLLHQIKRHRTHLESFQRHPLLATPYALLSEPLQKLDALKSKLDEKMQQSILQKKYLLTGRHKQALALQPTAQLKHMRSKLSQFEKNLQLCTLNLVTNKTQKLKALSKQLNSVNPTNVLKRGYSILFDEKHHSVIVSAQELIPNQKLRAQFADGEAKMRVDDE
ncbi:MAG: Exodeoxyribonuclease 7 large subunit [Chlamydiales bacterium]|nr:Exodeoxyribonuclease 7 large subunit [Chlamydiales bacterium]